MLLTKSTISISDHLNFFFFFAFAKNFSSHLYTAFFLYLIINTFLGSGSISKGNSFYYSVMDFIATGCPSLPTLIKKTGIGNFLQMDQQQELHRFPSQA